MSCTTVRGYPIIGDMKVQDITPRVVDKYIQTLQKTPAVNTRNHHAKTEFVTNATIDKIIKLLRCAFKQAVRWELVSKNPFDNVILPKYRNAKASIWIRRYDPHAWTSVRTKLYVATNLAFTGQYQADGYDLSVWSRSAGAP